MLTTVFGWACAEEKNVSRKLAILYGGNCSGAALHCLSLYHSAPLTPTSIAVGSAPSAPFGQSECILDDQSTQLLRMLNISYNIYEHPSSPTIESWRPHVELVAPSSRLCKNLFLKDRKQKDLLLVVALAETVVDMQVLLPVPSI